MATTEELKKDVEELRLLLEQAHRPKVKDLLAIDIRKLETEIIHKLEQQKAENVEVDGYKESPSTKIAVSQARYTVDVKEYAWDQSDKFMKIYATIEGVESVSEGNITCDFTNRSFKLSVKDVKNKDYQVYVSNLFEDIEPKDSYYKVKTNTVLIMLKKKQTGKTWAYVTEKENQSKAKETKKPKYDESKDPSDSLMDLMKQMYEDGDDEMKRTIQKAWVESREKQGHGI
ncbi:hypothetical protein CHS0354_037657 [Potamilus streckersoni]|uniref:Calcyclin-binding protein n=1 Tax=Potamilus streckersoni TaxID=2493646 RepID=A0AAE0T7N6_9BIVA|nr:hypothetical protein CHS0354_037657 [Potamilus streckersoni]